MDFIKKERVLVLKAKPLVGSQGIPTAHIAILKYEINEFEEKFKNHLISELEQAKKFYKSKIRFNFRKFAYEKEYTSAEAEEKALTYFKEYLKDIEIVRTINYKLDV